MSKTVKVFLVLAAVGIVGYWFAISLEDIPNNEVKVPIMGRDHVSDTSVVEYNSNPPTSGPHFGQWNRTWEFYDTALPVGGLIHNMEHGGVVIFYQSSLDQAVKDQLKNFTEENKKIIASINDYIKAPIVMAAWGVYEEFDLFDEPGMKRFYKKNLNHAPENVYP